MKNKRTHQKWKKKNYDKKRKKFIETLENT